MKCLLVVSGVFMGITTAAYWLIGRAIITMDDWVNEPDPDPDEEDWDEYD